MINLALLGLNNKATVILAMIPFQILVVGSRLVQRMIFLKTFSLILDLIMMTMMISSLVKKEKRINLGLGLMEGLEEILEWEVWEEWVDKRLLFNNSPVLEGLVEVEHKKVCHSLLK